MYLRALSLFTIALFIAFPCGLSGKMYDMVYFGNSQWNKVIIGHFNFFSDQTLIKLKLIYALYFHFNWQNVIVVFPLHSFWVKNAKSPFMKKKRLWYFFLFELKCRWLQIDLIDFNKKQNSWNFTQHKSLISFLKYHIFKTFENHQ